MRTFVLGILALAMLSGLSPRTDKPSVSRLTPQSIEWRDVMDFLGLNAWKMRVASDQPFNTMAVSLGWYERQNGAFVRQSLGETLEVTSLQKISEKSVSVMWRVEGPFARFHVSCPDEGAFNATVPVQRLANYVPVGGGNPSAGFFIDGQHIIAVKWRNDAPVQAPEKRYMDAYIAVQFELGVLKGLND